MRNGQAGRLWPNSAPTCLWQAGRREPSTQKIGEKSIVVFHRFPLDEGSVPHAPFDAKPSFAATRFLHNR